MLPVLHNVARVGGVGDRRREGGVEDGEAHGGEAVSEAGTRINNTLDHQGRSRRINSIPPIAVCLLSTEIASAAALIAPRDGTPICQSLGNPTVIGRGRLVPIHHREGTRNVDRKSRPIGTPNDTLRGTDGMGWAAISPLLVLLRARPFDEPEQCRPAFPKNPTIWHHRWRIFAGRRHGWGRKRMPVGAQDVVD